MDTAAPHLSAALSTPHVGPIQHCQEGAREVRVHVCVCHSVNFQTSSWLNGMWLEEINNNNNNKKIKASLSQPRALLLYWEPGSGLWCLQNISDFSQLSKLGLGPWWWWWGYRRWLGWEITIAPEASNGIHHDIKAVEKRIRITVIPLLFWKVPAR